MCEINPKRRKFFRLEFFTTCNMSDLAWQDIICEKLIELEQSFNKKGDIRVHVHEEEGPLSGFHGVFLDQS